MALYFTVLFVLNRYNKNLLSQLCFKRALLLRISHYMFRLLIKPSSSVSKHKILKVAVTDPLLKLMRLTIHVTDGHVESIYSLGKKIKIKYNSSIYKTVMCKRW
jgi:hypothetical protein